MDHTAVMEWSDEVTDEELLAVKTGNVYVDDTLLLARQVAALDKVRTPGSKAEALWHILDVLCRPCPPQRRSFRGSAS